MSQDSPDLYDYLDHRAYLSDWFDAKKKANPRFSHRLFARLAGQKSPSLLLNVIENRRNLTGETTEAFAKALGLKAEDRAHFIELVRLNQASTAAERNEAWRRISAARRFRDAHRVEGEGFRYLSHWYIPAIRELATIPGCRSSPDWLASMVRPKITVKQAREAVATLKELKLVHEEDGEIVAMDGSVVTAHQVQGLAVHNYHQGMLDRAKQTIEDVGPDERHFLGVTVAIPRSMVPLVKDELNRFQKRLLDLCDSAEAQSEQVFQLQLQLFPLSKTIDQEEDK